MKKIGVSDYTLKILCQERAVPLLFREKTALASGIDNFGADIIELCAIKSLKEDTIVYRTISSAVKNSEVAIPVGFTVDDVKNAWECVKEANNPCLQICVPVSTVQMEYLYHLKEEKMLLKIEELCKAAKELCGNIEFEALDATRADEGFLIKACKKAEECGVKRITVCDDAGLLMPEEFGKLVRLLKSECSADVFVRVSDNLNMAVACAMESVKAGADGVKSAVAGENVLLTDKFADAVIARGESFSVYTGLKETEIHNDINNIIKNISHESYSSSSQDTGKNDVFLDADSTIIQVCEASALLGYDLSDEDAGNVYKALLRVCERKSSVGAKELEAIIASSALQVPSTYHLESYTANSSNITMAMANVVLTKEGEKLCGVSTGDGPIDAAFRAIEQSIGYHYELDNFEIQAVTEGKEAIGSALVRLRNNGRLYSGDGLSTDIVGASIRAYINALNKIVFEEK
ncbi:MAG: hypothetical protein IJU45_08350 [Clostridia bacterium]|nr:hypothetical protein [Clostridia bacterium]